LFCSAFFVEAPLGAIEGIVRFLVFTTLGLLHIFVNCIRFTCSRRHRSIPLKELILSVAPSFKEGLLSLAASPSLLVPFIAPCFVYRHYDLDNEWDLSPIPTIAGWVDARRFITFTYGGGFLARNVSPEYENKNGKIVPHNDESQAALERGQESENMPRDEFVKKVDTASKMPKMEKVLIKSILGTIDADCQDSCNHSIIGAPRVISYSLGRVVRGDDVEDLQ
jgi:hypothetical protein